MPGSRTRTFLAELGPILMTPTLSYCAGVPGAAKLCIQVTEREAAVAPPELADAGDAGAQAATAPSREGFRRSGTQHPRGTLRSLEKFPLLGSPATGLDALVCLAGGGPRDICLVQRLGPGGGATRPP